jgi:hypothetical protein
MPSMPGKLVVVLILLSLNVITHLTTLSLGGGTGGTYVGIAFNVMLIAGLVMGREWARMLAKIVAVLSLVLGGVALLALLSLGGAAFVVPGLAVAAYVGVGLSLGVGGYILWCMNQQDVLDWLMARSLQA